MKRLLAVLAMLTIPCLSFAVDIDCDADSDNQMDLSCGGTNADTAANARTSLGVPATAATLVGDCTVGPCLDGSTDGGNLIKLWAGTGSYWTALQGGAPAANRSWRLPIEAPPSAGEQNIMYIDEYGAMKLLDKPGTTGYVLSSTDAGVLSWATPSGSGDMVLADAQTVTGAKTFNPSMLLMKGTSTGVTTFATANTGASNYTVTFPATTGTVALTSQLFDPASPGAIGGTTPAAGTFTTLTADEILSTCAGTGDCYSKLPNNSSAPSAATVVNGLYTYLNELYGVENSGTASKLLMEKDIDDTPSDGNTSQPASSNSVADHISAADPHTGYTLESALGTGVLTMLGNAPGAEAGPTTTIEAGTSALGTAEIASGACASAVTTAATNAATTDVINWGFNGDPTGVTGYAPTANGMLTIIAYPSSGNVNFKVCNLTAAAITPGAVTLNWRIQR